MSFSDALDIRSSCFVFASAGSGKTKTLVDRYVKLLVSGKKPRNILCLTFTNNAVFEMQSRISEILKRLLLNQDFAMEYLKNTLNLKFSDSKIQQISKQLFFDFQDDLQNAKILTIHSFCKEILKRFPLETGISLNFEMIDEKLSFDLLSKAKKTTFERIEQTEDFQELVQNISLSKFEELLKSLYSDSLKFELFFEQHEDLNKYEFELAELFRLSSDDEFSEIELKYIEEFFRNENLQNLFLTKNGTIRKKLPGENSELSKSIAEKVFQNFQNDKKKLTIRKTKSFLKVAKLIFDEYNNLKQKKSFLDFSDILIKTKNLLTKKQSKEFVLFKICSELEAVMIDEAQDLSVVQWQLAALFCEEIFSPGNEKTLFIVGDVKQSIYRFQDANHKLFLEFHDHCQKTFEALEKPFKTVCFNRSFRSLPKILDFTDNVFCKNSFFAFSQTSADYQRHIPNRKEPTGIVEIVEKSETQDIADFIENLISENKLLPKDILILSRSRDRQYNDLIKSLQQKGIKIAPPDRILLNDSFLIMDILGILRVCLNPQNAECDLASILKSPYVFSNPLSDSDLFKICHNRAVPVLENLKNLFPEHFSIIEDYIEISKTLSPLNFLFYISTKLLIYSETEQYIVSNCLEEAQKFWDNASENFESFLEFFWRNKIWISNQISDQNAIACSTIHGAKGLESKIVILLDFSLKVPKNKLNYVWKYDEKIFFTNKQKQIAFFLKPNSSSSFSESDAIVESEYQEEESELFRLLYVALTRAQDNLYIVGTRDANNITSLLF